MATMTPEVSAELISKFGKSKNDTASPEVQVALLTHKIRELTEHIKVNKKDFHSRLGLTKMVSKRKKLLKYISRVNLEGYRGLIKTLGLRH